MQKPKSKKRLPCCIDGCDNPSRTLGMCNKHYLRLNRHGDPLAGRAFDFESREWLDQHSKVETDECLIFPYGKFSKGYGTVNSGERRQIYAHRYMCEKVHGPAPIEGMEACHNCGNTECVNPRHLRWDTHVGNMSDKASHGTLLFGESHPSRKISLEQAEEVFKRAWSGESTTALAKEFGISPPTVSMIKHGKSWKIDLANTETFDELTLRTNNTGVKHLTCKDVRSVRSMIEAGYPLKEIARILGIRYGRVTAINRGQYYAGIKS